MKFKSIMGLFMAIQSLVSAYGQTKDFAKTQVASEQTQTPRDPRKDWELVHGSLKLPAALRDSDGLPRFVHGTIDSVRKTGDGSFRLRGAWTEPTDIPALPWEATEEETKAEPRRDSLWLFVPQNASLEKLEIGNRVHANRSEFSEGTEIEVHPTARNPTGDRDGEGYYADSMLLIDRNPAANGSVANEPIITTPGPFRLPPLKFLGIPLTKNADVLDYQY